ncbi:bacterioferritin-associated ferredoxin, partial [Escherichia coli]|nr:bacterioferritin-associated ferredoxin [Escherichia coli]
MRQPVRQFSPHSFLKLTKLIPSGNLCGN